MVAIYTDGEIKRYGKIPAVWNGIINYNSDNNIEQQQVDGWKPLVTPEYNYRIEKLGDIVLDGEVYKYTVEPLPVETVVENVQDELGSYLDDVYPLWERIKHTAYGSEAMLAMIQGTEYDVDRLAMVQNLLAWITRCRKDAENQINEFVNNGVIPSFEFEARPE